VPYWDLIAPCPPPPLLLFFADDKVLVEVHSRHKKVMVPRKNVKEVEVGGGPSEGMYAPATPYNTMRTPAHGVATPAYGASTPAYGMTPR